MIWINLETCHRTLIYPNFDPMGVSSLGPPKIENKTSKNTSVVVQKDLEFVPNYRTGGKEKDCLP